MNLAEMTVSQFADTLASDAPAPGGGSAAALMGALGAGLTAMVACLTQGRKKYAEYAEFATSVETHSTRFQEKLLDVMDRDTQAFNAVSAAFAMPRDTDAQKAARSAAIQSGLKGCTNTPLECMELCDEAIKLAYDFLEAGFTSSSASDLGVAFLSLKSAMQGAWLNVCINLSSIKDEAFAEAYRARGNALLERSLPLADAGYEKVLAMIQN